MPLRAHQLNRRYFEEAYRTGRHGWPAAEPSPYVDRFLRAPCLRRPGARLLDVGSGEGRHLLVAAPLGFDPWGVDYEPRAIARARSAVKTARLEGKVHLLVADALRLPFGPASFDVILDYGCLHHLPKADWPRYVCGVLGALRPGGHYLLSTFSRHFRVFGDGPLRRSWHLGFGAYRHFFDRAELRALLSPTLDVLQMEEEQAGERGF